MAAASSGGAMSACTLETCNCWHLRRTPRQQAMRHAEEEELAQRLLGTLSPEELRRIAGRRITVTVRSPCPMRHDLRAAAEVSESSEQMAREAVIRNAVAHEHDAAYHDAALEKSAAAAARVEQARVEQARVESRPAASEAASGAMPRLPRRRPTPPPRSDRSRSPIRRRRSQTPDLREGTVRTQRADPKPTSKFGFLSRAAVKSAPLMTPPPPPRDPPPPPKPRGPPLRPPPPPPPQIVAPQVRWKSGYVSTTPTVTEAYQPKASGGKASGKASGKAPTDRPVVFVVKPPFRAW